MRGQPSRYGDTTSDVGQGWDATSACAKHLPFPNNGLGLHCHSSARLRALTGSDASLSRESDMAFFQKTDGSGRAAARPRRQHRGRHRRAARGHRARDRRAAPSRSRADVDVGHKFAVRAITAGERIVKYGAPIGVATRDIEPGEYVHTHNMTSDYLPDLYARRRAPVRQGGRMMHQRLSAQRTAARASATPSSSPIWWNARITSRARSCYPFREQGVHLIGFSGLLSRTRIRTR